MLLFNEVNGICVTIVCYHITHHLLCISLLVALRTTLYLKSQLNQLFQSRVERPSMQKMRAAIGRGLLGTLDVPRGPIYNATDAVRTLVL